MIKLLFRKVNHDSIKQAALSAMEEYKTFVFEIDSINTWLTRVLKNEKPVVLQSFANWSLPCRKIVPILEKRALEDEGKWVYARMDIDEMSELASALEIVKVPTLFLINKGNLMNRVEGIITDKEIEELIEDARLVGGLMSDETVFEGFLLAGEDFIKEKKYNEAIRSLTEALVYKGFGEKYKERIWEGLIKVYFLMGDYKKALEYVEKVRNSGKISDGVSEIYLKIVKNQENEESQNKGIESLKDVIRLEPENYEKISELALAYHKADKNEQAVELCLELIMKEKSFKGFGQRTVVQIINTLGPDHVLTKPTRKKLQSLFIKFS